MVVLTRAQYTQESLFCHHGPISFHPFSKYLIWGQQILWKPDHTQIDVNVRIELIDFTLPSITGRLGETEVTKNHNVLNPSFPGIGGHQNHITNAVCLFLHYQRL